MSQVGDIATTCGCGGIGHAFDCPAYRVSDDACIPPTVKSVLMTLACIPGREVSYFWLCDLYRKTRDARDTYDPREQPNCSQHPTAPHELACSACVELGELKQQKKTEEVIWQVKRLQRCEPADEEMRNDRNGEWILRSDVLDELATIQGDYVSEIAELSAAHQQLASELSKVQALAAAAASFIRANGTGGQPQVKAMLAAIDQHTPKPAESVAPCEAARTSEEQ